MRICNLSFFITVFIGVSSAAFAAEDIFKPPSDGNAAKMFEGMRPLTSKFVESATQFSEVDMALSATIDLAHESIQSASRKKLLCLGVVGMAMKEPGPKGGPPDIPEHLLSWVKDFYPNTAPLSECIERWAPRSEIKLTKPNAELIILYYPESIYPNFLSTAFENVEPGDIHTNGMRYLIRVRKRIWSGDVLLIDEDRYRRYSR